MNNEIVNLIEHNTIIVSLSRSRRLPRARYVKMLSVGRTLDTKAGCFTEF